MTAIPDRLNTTWLGTLTDADLIDVEAQLRARFIDLENREKKVRGRKYDLVRGPADLMAAWDRWSRVCTATRARSLNPRRHP